MWPGAVKLVVEFVLLNYIKQTALQDLLTFPGIASEHNSFSRRSEYRQTASPYVVLPTMLIVGSFRRSHVCGLLFNRSPTVPCHAMGLSRSSAEQPEKAEPHRPPTDLGTPS